MACDLPPQSQPEDDPDFVMGICGSTLSIANATIRHAVQRTLDLGTGCGIQALLAAAHSEQVFAVDRNSRALDFARFNAKLNRLRNIDFFEGDLFQPVETTPQSRSICRSSQGCRVTAGVLSRCSPT